MATNFLNLSFALINDVIMLITQITEIIVYTSSLIIKELKKIIQENHIQTGALFAIGLINTEVHNENDPAFVLLLESEDEEFYIKSINNERIEKNYLKKQNHKKDDQKWSKKNVVKQQEFEIKLGNEHILFETAKIKFLVNIQESNDFEELEIKNFIFIIILII
ncbi:hypothetical protein RhiirA4_527935 [Rhizophagus irregularis]|uniref:Uncharacterized protein n=1 Tax=Rhizophagus irregularis TaxID=588596 RepID=A0A2I1GSB4_9GLOM|nr:hypothetical protein RhiirA4_527935 [Rhizophagus irregularis]